METTVSHFFSDAEKERIRLAVQSAERQTSGEIVPYIVEKSDDYEVAEWRGGALLAAIAAVTFILLHRLTSLWLPVDFAGMVLTTLFASALGMMAVRFIAPLKRVFAGKELRSRRVGQRAAQAFIAEEVFKTRERTGILIFISLLERHVLVLADSGISARVKQDEWDDVVQTIIRGITQRTAAEGIVQAIQRCGDLLQRRGVEIRKDDTDELGDSVRMSDR